MLALLLPTGCDISSPPSREVTVTIETSHKERLPLAPHVVTLNALPTPAMEKESRGLLVAFTILDKRTQEVRRLVARVGEPMPAPWGGNLTPLAFAPDLVIQEKHALHGPEGHVNPATWVELRGVDGTLLHQGWLFSRDPALTAWDHHRFDLTFLGPEAGNGG